MEGKNEMNIRNDKGITLITLIVTVVILVILTYVTVSTSMDMTATSRFENLQTYMLLIQTKCEYLSNQLAIGEIYEDELIGTKQTSGEFAGWYKLSQGDLNAIGVKDAHAEDGYYINYATNDVAYEKGIEFQGFPFTYLSEILDYSNR